jgi:hypothetical protein
VIEKVEKSRLQSEPLILADENVLGDAEVHIRVSRPDKRVAARRRITPLTIMLACRAAIWGEVIRD